MAVEYLGKLAMHPANVYTLNLVVVSRNKFELSKYDHIVLMNFVVRPRTSELSRDVSFFSGTPR